MSDTLPILPDDEPVSIPSQRTIRGGDPDTLGRIDHYDLLRKLGGGGFGVVYLARDTASGVEVAIKTLHPLLKHNAEEMDLLREKFALVSRLSHPNIATALVLHPVRNINVFDEAARRELKLAPGDSVMVMRYAPGVTLSKWRRQFPGGVVPPDLALEVGRQIAAALDYAHDERIVHRDIKPGNIMVETLGGASSPSEPQGPGAAARRDASPHRLRVRILDFGLAAEIRSSMSRVSTEAGDTSGTRPYMAPEQWLGKKQDGRTDQYALACVLYELLSGAPPFAGVFETGDPVIMMATVKGETPDEIEDVSPDTNEALLRALSKMPNDRFPTCAAFVAALDGTAVSDETKEPHLLLSALADGEEAVGAQMAVWGQTFKLPARLSLDPGVEFGPADVSYVGPGGHRFTGRLGSMTVDWIGGRSVSIALAPEVHPAGGRKQIRVPVGASTASSEVAQRRFDNQCVRLDCKMRVPTFLGADYVDGYLLCHNEELRFVVNESFFTISLLLVFYHLFTFSGSRKQAARWRCPIKDVIDIKTSYKLLLGPFLAITAEDGKTTQFLCKMWGGQRTLFRDHINKLRNELNNA